MKKILFVIFILAFVGSYSYLQISKISRHDSLAPEIVSSITEENIQPITLTPTPLPTEIDSTTLDYFQEIALGSEYGDHMPTIGKWGKDTIGVSVNGTHSENDMACLNQTISDFNTLSSRVKLNREEASSDITIHFAPEATFGNILKEYVPRNMGFFWTRGNNLGVLNEATILIDTSAVSEIERCHLIREELTQSLGLMNDSPQFSDSIFYTEWTRTTAYSELDKKAINLLYGEYGIQAGMSRAEVEELFLRK